jgi:hypothetical protein
MPRLKLENYSPCWGSHMLVLMRCFELSEGSVLEMGIGVFSTPLLHMLCFRNKRLLVSYDNDSNFVNSHRGFITPWHQLSLVKDWDEINIEDTKWGLAFLDHGPGERRLIDAQKLANNAQLVVCHDSELEVSDYYKYDEISKLFKYRYDYKDLMPNTSVFSNFIDITNLKI